MATVKGVSFFGPNSEYVISGSDCSNCFFWDKETEAIVNFAHGDRKGVVNCLEPHPKFPILATSGIDHDVKIWSPESHDPDSVKSTTSNLGSVIEKNIRDRRRNAMVLDDVDTVSTFVRHCLYAPRHRARVLAAAVANNDLDVLADHESDTISDEMDEIEDNDVVGSDNFDTDDETNDENDLEGGSFRGLPCPPS